MAKHKSRGSAYRRLWERIAEPRVKRMTFLVVYLFHTVAGIGILLTLPAAATSALGLWPTITLGSLLTVGGVFGAIAVLPGWNFVERIALTACFVGIALTSLFLLAQPTNAGTVALWALITGWLVVFAERGWDIRLYSIAPTT